MAARLLLSAAIVCAAAGKLNLRLDYGGRTDGFLMVEEGRFYHPVCPGKFLHDRRWAEVVCRTLGFQSTHALNVYGSKYIQDVGDLKAPLKVELNCSDTAPASACAIQVSSDHRLICDLTSFTPDKLSAVMCTNSVPKFRVTHVDPETGIGRPELEVAGQWGALCAGVGSPELASVACRMSRWPSTNAKVYTQLYNGGDIGGALTQAKCIGTEDHLVDCPQSGWLKSCPHNAYLGLQCTEADESEVRISGLRGGTTEIYHQGAWNAVGSACTTDQCRDKAASVVCRSLNFSSDGARGRVKETETLCWMELSECTGNETSILDCPGANSSLTEKPFVCDPLQVECDAGEEVDLDLDTDGLLTVLHDGYWGTVCAPAHADFTNFAASAVCKSQREFSTLATVSYNSSVVRSGPIWYSGLYCDGAIADLSGCSWEPTLSCSHDRDVFISCQKLDRANVAYRLSDTVGLSYVGVPQMRLNGVWGSVCLSARSSFDANIAKVLCRSAGKETEFARFVDERKSYHTNLVNATIWLDASRISCKGTEGSLLDCNLYEYFGDTSCGGSAHLPELYCGSYQFDSDFSLRLVDGGRLEMMLYNEWGTVCNENFTQADAAVACRSLHGDWSYSAIAENGTYKKGKGKIWLKDLSCGGTLHSFSKCTFRDLGYTGCQHSQDVGIRCSTDGPTTPVNTGYVIVGSVGGTLLQVAIVAVVVYTKKI